MATLARVNVLLGLEDKNFGSGLASAQKKLDNFGKAATRIGRTMTTMLTVPLIGAAGVALKWASDTTEAVNKVNVVFGQNASEVLAWSDTTAKSLGIAKADSLEMVGTFGNLFTSMKIGSETASDMSMTLVKLAADQASFNNLPTEDVLTKIQAGLVGEYEGLRSLGIILDETSVKQRALANNIGLTEDQLTPAMLAQARYELILEQSTNAMDDFSETSNSTANRMKILRARIKDVGARFGQALLPALERGMDLFERLLGWFEKLSPATQRWIVIIAMVVAAIGPLLIVLGSMASGLAAIIAIAPLFLLLVSPISLVIAALVALGIAYQLNLFGFRDAVNAVVGPIVDFAQRVIEAFGVSGISGVLAMFAIELDKVFGATATNAIISFFENVIDLVSGFIDIVRTAVQLVGALISGDWSRAWQLFQNLVSQAVDFAIDYVLLIPRTLLDAIPGVQEFAQTVWSWITNVAASAFRVLLDKANEYLVPVFQWMGGPGYDAVTKFAGDVERFIGNAADAFVTMWDTVGPVLRNLQQLLTMAVLLLVNLAITAGKKLDAIGGYFGDLWDDISGFVEDITGAFSGLGEKLAGFLQPLVGKLQALFDAASALFDLLGIGGGDDAQAAFRSLSTMYAGGVAGEKELALPGQRRGVEPPYQGSRTTIPNAGRTSSGTLVTGLPAVGTGTAAAFGGTITAAADAAAKVSASVGKILAVVASMSSGVPTMVAAMTAKVQASFATMGSTVPSATTAMVGRVLAAFASMGGDVPALTTAMTGRVLAAFASMSSDVGTLASSTGQRVATAFSTMRSTVTATVNSMVGQVLVSMVSLSSQMGILGQAAGNTFRSGIASGFAGAVAAAQSGAAQIRAAASIGSLFGQGFSVGASLGQGIASGIMSYVGSVAAAAASIVGAAVSAARSAAAASSPSKKMMMLGTDMAEGLILGLNRAQYEVAGATAALIQPPGLGRLAGMGGRAGGMNLYGDISITVSGAGDPEAVANEVFRRFDREIGLREGY